VNSGRAATATTIRAATAADRPHIFELMRASIGWDDDPRLTALFAWKHDTNPFGPSPAWVAVAGERIIGFRTFMRWEFVLDGHIVRAVRAVDTATHPDHQGRGIFRQLTLTGLDALQADGVDMVFNTPNDQSRPGYLKMGWHVVGRLPLVMRPSRLASIARLRGARVPAERWSMPTSMGEPPRFPARAAGVDAGGLVTNRRDAYLEWRYGLEPLAYRVLALEDDTDALAVFRLRRRGSAVEAAVAELFATHRSQRRELLRAVARLDGVDYAAALSRNALAHRALSLRRIGPILTARSISGFEIPPLPGWQLALGDVELF
jgi:GNAT superfamily N-acetyltransferase